MGNPNEPTRREVELAKTWNAVAKLMAENLESRSQSSEFPADAMTRYAPLKTLLDDSFIDDLSCLTPASRSAARKDRRLQYGILLERFRREIRSARAEFVDNRDSQKNWTEATSLRDAWVIKTVLFELKLAFILHGMRLSFGTQVACHAYCALRRCFPPAPIIPIRI